MKLQIFLCLVGLAAVRTAAPFDTNAAATAAGPSAADAATNKTSVSTPQEDHDASRLDNNVGGEGGHGEESRRRLQRNEQVIQNTVYHYGPCHSEVLLDDAKNLAREEADSRGDEWNVQSVRLVGDPRYIPDDGRGSCEGDVEIVLVKGREIWVSNSCNEPVDLTLLMKSSTLGVWVCPTWTIPPNESDFFRSNGKRQRTAGTSNLYWHAESAYDGSTYAGMTGDHIKECNSSPGTRGRYLDMNKASASRDRNSYGNWSLKITCNRRLRAATTDDNRADTSSVDEA
ncbi:unnamed protein product [Vitrella brassicaformis CCMP3155]|uniref:Uncharacterized protein n=1 Tax=Vitrella brassicaformis (strain CCMP3155) TaxID=1169540 RepID=A0A0G4FB89_VITBC|nr:unnamed protein product [Vitrella brassicaformis CCMP3155]|eukprot:CEM09899.1 unnamed protein product [Vitrella brassicaformis CCMP3155]